MENLKYIEDAYHSLSIEGLHGDQQKLIEKGSERPVIGIRKANQEDRRKKGMRWLHRGYYQAFQAVNNSIRERSWKGKMPGEVADE